LKTYWDTSAVINAAVSTRVMDRLDSGEHVTRLHTLAEFFSTMTGRGVLVRDDQGNVARVVFDPNDCASWLRKFAGKVQFDDLDKAELLNALDKAQSRSVQGTNVYDYWHVLVSAKAKADEILTRNTSHFEPLNQAIKGCAKVQWP
jgi:hypothetical protein